ncbi:ubiquinol oxidase subunit II [Sphingosinicella sp. BN140058]|uniref:ubiquinol oxidase subunit II n=1 Tax=Sphingosinicella sp. BN140058 TaxID=1892855 RepID=UPI0010127E35|nr:ubiquinol oxidase subunit II [Sphingosinicella sp. BN140058]QAY75251.1 ubiquinol oxidase subunit II [Sphingosinicella sp. BN140058]
MLRSITHRILPVLALPLLGGCDWVVMNPAGDVAAQQRDLVLISTALMLLIIVPVMALTVIFAIRYRATRKTPATYDPDFDHSTMLELAIWGAPLLIIIALGALTWTSTHLLDPYRPIGRIAEGRPVPADAKPLEVQVVALDWKWLFIYPEQGIATVNELVVPVDRPLRFRLTASSVMNSFYAPALAGMIYAMPGMETKLHAVLNKPGQFEGISSNYSGAGFSDMKFRMTGVDEAGFATWVQGVRQGGGKADAPTYLELAKPSEREPVRRFSIVQPGLFDRIVGQCVEPGRPCGGHGHGGHKAEGALEKEPHEKGSGPHMTAPPRQDHAPGVRQPGHPANRDLTFLKPVGPAAAAHA